MKKKFHSKVTRVTQVVQEKNLYSRLPRLPKVTQRWVTEKILFLSVFSSKKIYRLPSYPFFIYLYIENTLSKISCTQIYINIYFLGNLGNQVRKWELDGFNKQFSRLPIVGNRRVTVGNQLATLEKAGFNFKRVIEDLYAHGLLETDSDRRRKQKLIRIAGLSKRQRVYWIKNLLPEGTEEDANESNEISSNDQERVNEEIPF